MKRRSRAVRRVDFVSYVVRIADWDRWWSFSVTGDSRWARGPYSEYGTLILRGHVFRPEGFKFPQMEITISGEEMMKDATNKPVNIGLLYVSESLLKAHVSVPSESIGELTTLAASGRLQVVHLSGTPLRYRQGTVHGIELNTEFISEDW